MIKNIELEALELYKKDLEKLISKQSIKVQKEKEKQENKLKAIYEEYPSENAVMDDYAFGGMTESKKDKLLELFRNKDKVNNEQSADGRYLNILTRTLKSINIELQYPDTNEYIDSNNSEVEQMKKCIEELELKNKELKEFQKLNNEKKHNARGAGRKTKFTEEDKTMIKMYRFQKKTLKEIAEMYNCSIALIHKLINE